MRMLVSSLALLAVVAFGVAADDPPDGKNAPPAKKKAPPAKDDSPLQTGKDLPGPFHPYNVTGPHKQHFHCLVSDHGLDPMVMIFHKNVDFADPLPNLLKKLDTAIDKNPAVRLGSFVVFLPEDLPEVVGSDDKNDDARNEVEKKVEQAGADMKLKHVVLCLDSKADVEKYHLSDSNLVTIVLYKKFETVAVFALPQSEFTDAAIEKIMAAVGDKLGAKRQK
ncbi:MAG TPA: hypothetical protein VN688_02625 [Gemmataceae bacterium]|nr:hypothetical protein [Gemmataceae bacterium]